MKFSFNKKLTKNNSRINFFEAFGVAFQIVYTDVFSEREIVRVVKNSVPVGLKKLLESNIEIKSANFEHAFSIELLEADKFSLKKNSEEELIFREKQSLLDRLESLIRLTVGEFAPTKIFIHAGVVELNGRALIVPARSFKGKTSLIVELIKSGAAYYSDEYAVVDESGFVYPFPKTLSVRGIIDRYTQLERPIEFYGARRGRKKIKAGLILITEYKKYARWKPQRLGQGETVLELISNTLPIRNRPEFTIKVLNKLASQALAVKSRRGEAKYFVKNLLNFYNREVV